MGGSQHALLYETTVQAVGNIRVADDCLSYVPSLQRSFQPHGDKGFAKGGRELWEPVVRSLQLDGYLKQLQLMQGVVGNSDSVFEELYFSHFDDSSPNVPSARPPSPSRRGQRGRPPPPSRASQEKLHLGERVRKYSKELVQCISSSIRQLQLQADARIAWFPRVLCSLVVDLLDVVHLLDVLKDKKESLIISLDPDTSGPSRGTFASAELQNVMETSTFLRSSWAVLSHLRKELEALQREKPHTMPTLAKLLEFVHCSLTAKDQQQLLVGKWPHVYLRALPILIHLYCTVAGGPQGVVPEGMDLKLVDKCLALVVGKPVLPGYGDATVNLMDPLIQVSMLVNPIRERDRPKVVPLNQQRDYERLEPKYSLSSQLDYIRHRHNELSDQLTRLAFFMDSCRRRLEVPPPEVVCEVLPAALGAMLEVARWSAALLELDAWRITYPTLPRGFEDEEQQQNEANAQPITNRPTFADEELAVVLELLAYLKGMCTSLSSHFTWMEPLLHQLAYQEMQRVVAGALCSLIKPPGQNGLTPQQQKVQELACGLKQCIQGLQTLDAPLTPPPKKRLTRVFTNIRGKKPSDGRLSPGPMPPSSPRPYETQPTGGAMMGEGSSSGGGSGAAWSGSGMMKSMGKLFKSKSEASIAESESASESAIEVLRQAPTDRHLQLLQILTEQLLREIQTSHPKRGDGESKGLSRTIKSAVYNLHPEVTTTVVKEIALFNHLLASLDVLLLLPQMTHQVADMSDLLLSESFMEKHNLPSSRLSNLPSRLEGPALDPMNILPVDLGLVPFSLYEDAWVRVRACARNTDLPSLVALSGALYAENFLGHAAQHAYEHYQGLASFQIVSSATFSYGTTAQSQRFCLGPLKACVFDNLFKQQAMELCGVRVDPREQLAFKLQIIIIEDLHRLMHRFESGKDVTTLTQLEFAVRLVQHTHKLLSQHLPLDGWVQTWGLMDPTVYQIQPKQEDPGHKVTAVCIPMLLNDLLPMFMYSSYSRKFIPRMTLTPSTPHQIPGSPSAATAAAPGFLPDSLSIPVWSLLTARPKDGLLDLPEDVNAPDPSYFGVEHVLAIKRMAGPKGLAAVVWKIKEYMKDLLQRDIPNQLQQLAACLPKEVLQPSGHVTTATGVFNFYNRHLAQVSTQKAIWEEPLKVLHMFGNAVALLHLVSTALNVDAANNMVQVSPLLGVFAEEMEGLRHCPPSQPSFYENLVLGNYAVQVPAMGKAALVQAEKKGWGATKSMDLWPKIWSDLSAAVASLEPTMNALHASSHRKGPPPCFHSVWSALLWVIIDQEITSGASRQLPYGEGPLWAGCFILHMLQQQNKFKIQDFTTLLLKREHLDSSGAAAGGKAAHMHNFVSIATRVMDIWQQLGITAQRLVQPELHSDDDEAMLPVLQSSAIPRYTPSEPAWDQPGGGFMAGGSDAGGPGVSPLAAGRFNNNYNHAHRGHFGGAKPSSMLRQASSRSKHSLPSSEDFAQWRPDPVDQSSAAGDLQQLHDQRTSGPRTGFNSASVVAAFIKPHYSKPAAPEHRTLSPSPGGLSPPPSRPLTAKDNPWSRVMNSMVSEQGPRASPPRTSSRIPGPQGPSMAGLTQQPMPGQPGNQMRAGARTMSGRNK